MGTLDPGQFPEREFLPAFAVLQCFPFLEIVDSITFSSAATLAARLHCKAPGYRMLGRIIPGSLEAECKTSSRLACVEWKAAA